MIVAVVVAYVILAFVSVVLAAAILKDIDSNEPADLAFIAFMAICWPITLPFAGFMWLAKQLLQARQDDL